MPSAVTSGDRDNAGAGEGPVRTIKQNMQPFREAAKGDFSSSENQTVNDSSCPPAALGPSCRVMGLVLTIRQNVSDSQ